MSKKTSRLGLVVSAAAFLALAAPIAVQGAPRTGHPSSWGPRWTLGVGWGWGWPYAGWYGPAYYPPPPYGPLRAVPGDAAGVELHLHPRKADVRVDGENAGQARDYNDYYEPLWLRPGRHALEFSHPGYMTLRIGIDVRRGGRYIVHDSLEEGAGLDPRSENVGPSPSGPQRRARLRIQVQPDDAAVYLDGEFLGRLDDPAHPRGLFIVAPGKHRVEAVRPGYQSQAIEVEVRPGEPAKAEVVLEPEDGA